MHPDGTSGSVPGGSRGGAVLVARAPSWEEAPPPPPPPRRAPPPPHHIADEIEQLGVDALHLLMGLLEGEEKRIALSRATAGTINGSERLVAANARVGDLSRACVAKTGALSQDPEFS
mmetsp:Transcript_29321/g.56281  ORF Transcript_29321/g.56281 Transcript_29321/m.56281 type:complete len:118 (-) Transcript_29321:278-631(-)|eukprot:CAMPEP_0114244786 /NCGR_PEP_ID=MMETSP0058-20121206/11531_1 /TAXON_ID=36894 /ORGANISM="Pyramimonas parkeae, CCMP726" /LENGTH=117 /DNA_ID=CAMNT_0001357761 /DNA_START=1151 /DNA_END=1504 /DNA_ORIENTATION=-